MPASAGPASMPPTAALPSITGRLFCRKPMYTRQMTGSKPDTGQQVCKEHPVHITAHKLKKTADAGLAGGVLFDALTGLEIVGRRKKTHSNCGTFLTFLTGTAGVLSGKCHCAGFTDINIPVFCQLCKIQPGLIVKKYLSLPFLRKMCYNDNGIFCNRRKPL